MVVRKLMMAPRDLVAKRIVFEEGYVTSLEFNSAPFLTPEVALSNFTYWVGLGNDLYHLTPRCAWR